MSVREREKMNFLSFSFYMDVGMAAAQETASGCVSLLWGKREHVCAYYVCKFVWRKGLLRRMARQGGVGRVVVMMGVKERIWRGG